MAEVELIGVPNKQAYTVVTEDSKTKAYRRVDIRDILVALAGEDVTNDVTKVEQRFSGQHVTADTLIKTGDGFLHSLTFAQTDAAPTAGSIIVYDNTAESGTKLFEWNLTTAVFVPFTVTLDVAFATGLYIGFTTTSDVAVTVSVR
jgi:hypothetical protein